MNEGAFALMDCLGFKGVWGRGIDPDQIVGYLEQSKLRSEKARVQSILDVFVPGAVAISTAFISDTVAVSVRSKVGKPLDDIGRGYLMLIAAQHCADLIRHFSLAPVPLLLRGCVTFGPHIVKDTFLLGPAVDEAASFAESPEGAFVWLTPSAARVRRLYLQMAPIALTNNISKVTPDNLLRAVEKLFEASITLPPEHGGGGGRGFISWWRRLTLDQQHVAAPVVLTALFSSWRNDDVVSGYSMQLKSGAVLNADVVNPLFFVPPDQQSIAMNRMLSSFTSTTLDVMVKQQNTANFLSIATQYSANAAAASTVVIKAAEEQLALLTGVPLV